MTFSDREKLLGFLQELTRLFLRDSLTVEDVIVRIGVVVRDPGIPLPIKLQPAAMYLSSASLFRDPNTGLPYLVALEPSPEAIVALGALTTIFGNYKRALTDFGMPPIVVFSPQDLGTRWRVIPIATLEPSENALETARISKIELRRDSA